MYSKQRSSSPIKELDKSIMNDSTDDSELMLMRTGDSTRSLLAGICNDNSHSETYLSPKFNDLPNFERNQVDNPRKVILDESVLSSSMSSIHSSSISNRSMLSKSPETMNNTVLSTSVVDENQYSVTGNVDGNNIPWEQWLLKKTIEDIENFNLKRTKRKDRSVEKKKLEEAKMVTLKKSVQQREEWVKKKDVERKNELVEKRKKILSDELKKEQAKCILMEKTCKKLHEWEEEKLKKEREEKKVLCEVELLANEKYEQKKLSSEESYKAWFERSKTKKLNRSTYGYSNGTLVSYYDMGCSPTPSYKNPLPWVDSMQPIDIEGSKLQQQSVFSPPLLWMDVEKRDPNSKRKSKQNKKVIVKHSCVK